MIDQGRLTATTLKRSGLIRDLLLVCTAVAAGNSAVDAAEPSRRVPQPGYECKIDERGDFGVIEANLQIFDTGEVRNGFIRWDAGDGKFQNPWVSAAFFRQKDGSYSLSSGYVSIMRHIWDRTPGRPRRTLKLQLEVTTSPTTMPGVSRITGDLEKSGGPFHIQLGWSDVAALAAGAPQLYLVARDTRKNLVDQVALDRMMFSRAQPHIMSAFAEAEKMAADPRSHCVHVDDVTHSDIVVT